MVSTLGLKNILQKSAGSLPQINAAEIQAQLSAWTEKVRQADVKKLIRDQLKIEKLFSRENYLIPFFEDSKTMVSLVKDYATGGYEMWSRRNPPSLKATRTDLIREAFIFWWWALFGWMGEKVKATRSSAYLAVAKAAFRHPKEAWVLAREFWK